MDPEEFRNELYRRWQQTPYNQQIPDLRHRIALQLATNMAAQSTVPSASFCPCVQRLLGRIKHGALKMSLIPRGYDSQTLQGQDQYRAQWAEVAVTEFVEFITKYLLPSMPKLQTLQLVAPEKDNSGNGFGEDSIITPGRRQGGYPLEMQHISLEAKIANVEKKVQKIKAKKLWPSLEADPSEHIWKKEWNLAHDMNDLLVIDKALRQRQEKHPTSPKIELVIEEYSKPLDWKHYRDPRSETQIDVEFLIASYRASCF